MGQGDFTVFDRGLIGERLIEAARAFGQRALVFEQLSQQRITRAHDVAFDAKQRRAGLDRLPFAHLDADQFAGDRGLYRRAAVDRHHGERGDHRLGNPKQAGESDHDRGQSQQ